MTTEFNQLIMKIKEGDNKCVTDVRNALEIYFTTTKWSLLKEEWDKMSMEKRSALADRLFAETR